MAAAAWGGGLSEFVPQARMNERLRPDPMPTSWGRPPAFLNAAAFALAAAAVLAGPSSAAAQGAGGATSKARPRVPAKVEPVLRSIDETGGAPRGYIGGRAYENRATRGEQPLPRVDRDGERIDYQTWDVDPETPGRSRGAERLITGSDGSAYYTADGYRTFTVVRNPARSHHGGADPETASPPKPNEGRPSTTPPPAPPRRDGGPGAGGSSRPPSSSSPSRPVGREGKPVVALDSRTAARVTPVLEHVIARGEPLPGYVGGRDYRNLGLDDGEVLPRTDDRGRTIRYREWDVNRKVPGRNRGAERLVTGSDGRAYYTDDHYATFRRIR